MCSARVSFIALLAGCAHPALAPPHQAPHTKIHALVPTHRLVGPSALDAELRALDPLMRRCFVAPGSRPTPRLKITLLERRGLPVQVVAVEPSDAPSGLVGCVTDTLTSELVRPLGSTGLMIVVAGPPT